jgi:hypothetical protein
MLCKAVREGKIKFKTTLQACRASVAGAEMQIAMIEVFAGKFNDCAEGSVIPPFFWRLSLVG